MKKATFLVLILLGGTLSLFAQGNKPTAPAFGFTFGVQGLQNLSVVTNPTVGFRYWMENGMTGRLSLNLATTNHTVVSNDPNDSGTENTVTTKNTNFGIAIGVQKNFTGTKNLNPYAGVDLGVSTAGGGTLTQRAESVDSTSLLGAVGNYQETVTTNPKGISIGLTPFVGFDYFFVPNLSLGVEFGWGLSTANQKDGKVETTSKFGSTTTTTSVSGGSDKNFTLGSHGSSTITMTVFF